MAEHWNNIGMKPLLGSALFGFGLHRNVHTRDLQPVGRWVWHRIVLIGEHSSGPLPFLTARENEELASKNKTLYTLASGKQTGYLSTYIRMQILSFSCIGSLLHWSHSETIVRCSAILCGGHSSLHHWAVAPWHL